MNDYTVRDRKNYGEMDVAKRAFPKFQEKLEIRRNLFFGYDYTPFYEGSDLQRGMTISGAVNFIVAPDKEEQKQSFIKEALMLKQALSLCSSMVKEHMRLEAAFFESVRVLVMRILYNPSGKKFSLKESNDCINELLKQSVKSDGVINLFSDVGEKVNLFDPTFLENISMRMIVKKLLKKYKYPPEGQEDALKTVISQCELWTDNVADYEDTVSYSINDGYGTLKVAEKNQNYRKKC